MDGRVPKVTQDTKGGNFVRTYLSKTRPHPKVLHQSILVQGWYEIVDS